MNVKILCVGKVKEKWILNGIKEYSKRLPRIEIEEIKDCGSSEKECKTIIDKIKDTDYVVAMSEEGDNLTSQNFAKFIKQRQEKIVFIIGGPDGITDALRKVSKKVISLSNMTFTHEMARLFLVEQLYRAYSINKNMNYHR